MIKKIIKFIRKDLWEKKDTGNGKSRWFIRPFRIALYTVRGIGQHDLFLRAAALTFFTLMSIVPIFALMFGIMKGFGFETQLIDLIYSRFPDYTELIDTIFEFVNRLLMRTSGGIVAGVGIVVLFWAVVRVFNYMEEAFNKIWDVREQRSIPRKFSDYIAVIFLAPILLVAIASLSTSIRSSLSWLEADWLLDILFWVAAMLLMWLLFAFVYWVIPNTRVKFKGALIAAIISGTAFYVFSVAYFYVQGGLNSLNAIYGTFAALPLFLIWLQTSWRIFLVGGELSFAYQNIEHYKMGLEADYMNIDNRRKIFLAAMMVVARRFVNGQGAVSSDSIADELELPLRIVKDTTFNLERAGLVIAVKNPDNKHENLYVPSRDVHTTTVYDVIEGMERSGTIDIDVRGLPKFRKVNDLLDDMKAMAADSEHNLRITDLL